MPSVPDTRKGGGGNERKINLWLDAGMRKSKSYWGVFSVAARKPALPVRVSRIIHTGVGGAPGSGSFSEKNSEENLEIGTFKAFI